MIISEIKSLFGSNRLLTVLVTLTLMSTNLAFSDEAEREEDVNDIVSIIELYLDGKISEAREKAQEKTDELSQGDDLNDPLLLIVDYLSGNKSAREEDILTSSEKKPGMWALGSMAIFVNNVSRGRIEPFELENNLNNYQLNIPGVKFSEIGKWEEQSESWMEWCEEGCKPNNGLEEALFKGKTKFEKVNLGKDIREVDLEKFIESRRPFSKRPRPRGLEFDKDVVNEYLETLPNDEMKRAEVRRFKYIRDIKEYLVRIFERNPYSGLIRMRTRSINGTVAMANVNIMRIRAGKKSMSCKWKDLHFKQFVTFMNHYAKQRLATAGPNVTKEERTAHAAEDYLRLAVLCDWYGRHEDAITYAKKALKLYPKLGKTANKQLLE